MKTRTTSYRILCGKKSLEIDNSTANITPVATGGCCAKLYEEFICKQPPTVEFTYDNGTIANYTWIINHTRTVCDEPTSTPPKTINQTSVALNSTDLTTAAPPNATGLSNGEVAFVIIGVFIIIIIIIIAGIIIIWRRKIRCECPRTNQPHPSDVELQPMNGSTANEQDHKTTSRYPISNGRL
ncbi:uncharacterized protein LOC143805341 isoform X2 [Ranitomeya variabilis]